MIVFDIIDAPYQRWQSVLGSVPVRITLRWMPKIEKWTLTIDIAGVRRVTNRIVVKGRDLLAPYNLGIGVIFAGGLADLTRDSLPAGDVRLYHASREEWDAALAS